MVVYAAKLPILNPNEFDLWKIRIEQLQKIVSQLEIHGVSLFQEDVNLKFLRTLPSEWKTHSLIWRNKTDLEDKSLDDLFNSLKIYESEVKCSSSLGTDSQNLAFVSSTPADSTNDSVSAAVNVSDVGAKLSASTLPNVDSLTEEEPTNFALMAFSSSSSNSSSDCEKGLESVEARLLVYKQNESVLEENIKLVNIEVQLRDTALATLRQMLETTEKEREDINMNDNDSWPPSNLYDRFVLSGGYHAVPPPVSVQLSLNKTYLLDLVPPSLRIRHSGVLSQPPMSVTPPVPLRTHSPSKGLRRTKKTCFVCKSETHLIKDCDFHARKLAQKSYASRDIHKQYAPMNHSKFLLHKVSTVASPKSQPVLTTAARPVSAVKPKVSRTRPNIASHAVSMSKSPLRRPFT
nr:hypothetical protein [Tanacetum cinerariifolium]